MLAALIGFVAPLLPDLIGLGKGQLDHRNEMAMLRLQLEFADKAEGHRLEETEIQAASADLRSARQPRQSYGVQILNAAHDAEGVLSRWVFNLCFVAFSMLDWLISSVRPFVTYGIVGLWAAIKLAIIINVSRQSGDWVQTLTAPDVWTQFDEDMLIMVLAYWFSASTLRRRKAAAA